MAAVTRRQYKGAAASTTITATLTSVATTTTLTATTGWPTTAAVPFYVVIDPGTSSEEKCSATISGSTLTLTRGADDTTAVAHSSGATIYPVFSADEADEANQFASTMTTRGDLLTMASGPTVGRIAIGTSGYLLTSNGTDAAWAAAPASGIADSATPYNTAAGYQAGSGVSVAAALGHTSFGYQAGKAITTGDRNTAVGYLAATAVDSGNDNTAVGYQALHTSTSGGTNVAIGTEACKGLTTGNSNVAIGYQALKTITYYGSCVAIGYQALRDNVESNTTAVGYMSGVSTSGMGNTSVGSKSQEYLLSGINNTSIGYYAGRNNYYGNNNSCVGYNSHPLTTSTSNTITLGNSSIATLRCQVTSITALSDERDKTQIKDSVYGLELVNMLRPVTFEWNMRDGGKVGQKDIGFIAQDLVAIEDALSAHDTLALTSRDNPDMLEASYGRLLPILVKAIQELSDKITNIEKQLA